MQAVQIPITFHIVKLSYCGWRQNGIKLLENIKEVAGNITKEVLQCLILLRFNFLINITCKSSCKQESVSWNIQIVPRLHYCILVLLYCIFRERYVVWYISFYFCYVSILWTDMHNPFYLFSLNSLRLKGKHWSKQECNNKKTFQIQFAC